MFRPETIVNVKNRLVDRIAYYKGMDVNDVKMCISKGNQKIGHVLNVSLAPIVTCGNCKECAAYCYDVRSCFQYSDVIDARARNTAIFDMNRDVFFSRLHDVMSRRRKNFFLRFHVSGEIRDLDHFSRMVETARMFPHYTVWTYTKMYWIVNEYVRKHGGSIKKAIPANFHVMFSEWRGLPMVNPYKFPVFRCVFTSKGEKLPKGKWVCPGDCQVCINACRGCVASENSVVEDH